MILSNVEAFIMLRREVDLCSLVVEIPVWCFIYASLILRIRFPVSVSVLLSPNIYHRKGAGPQKWLWFRRKTGNVSVFFTDMTSIQQRELWKRLERHCPISLIFSAQASNSRASIVLNMPQS
ncbi:hypothetical protein XENOCAPTIV_023964 [Xenoophorus captivus]|uniref:Uncharacterized protein n=1 Tax=Xenoophorus captivus TaxID=1517983 RepID=A0ABV0RRY4_9TELE